MTTYTPDKSYLGVLYPCHGITIQWYVREEDGINYLSCSMYQRSADMFLGVPFNISSYALLCYMFCIVINCDNDYDGLPFKPDRLIITFGDIHIYEDHYEQVKEQISRKPYNFPQIEFLNNYKNLEDFKWEDIVIHNYRKHYGQKSRLVLQKFDGEICREKLILYSIDNISVGNLRRKIILVEKVPLKKIIEEVLLKKCWTLIFRL